RAAAIYDKDGERLEQMQQGESLQLPSHYKDLDSWRLTEFRSTQVITVPNGDEPQGHLLLVASSELPTAFYTGTQTAS
ncbi:PAS domain-containing sensor histidine kinase, partial [Pseudomonas syringae pv. tagetis]